MPKKISTITGAVILLVLVAVAISGFVIFNNQQNFSVIGQSILNRIKKNTDDPRVKSPKSIPKATTDEQKNYILGTIKEVKKDSIVVTDLSGKDVIINFDSNTKFLKGEKNGQDATAADLAKDWNVAISFRPDNQDNIIAQTIHIVSKK